MAHHVSQANMNHQRMKTVSLWSLQKTANAILLTFKSIADPVAVHLKDIHFNRQQEMMLGLYDTLTVPFGVDA